MSLRDSRFCVKVAYPQNLGQVLLLAVEVEHLVHAAQRPAQVVQSLRREGVLVALVLYHPHEDHVYHLPVGLRQVCKDPTSHGVHVAALRVLHSLLSRHAVLVEVYNHFLRSRHLAHHYFEQCS